MDVVSIRKATTDAQLEGVWPVMQQLRPNIPDAAAFRTMVRRMEQNHGYGIVFRERDGKVVAAAGYRINEMLFRGRFLYVDDLITADDARSQGHGKALLDWLTGQAKAEGCKQVALDSGNQRIDAHRFYKREGFEPFAQHFVKELQ